MNHIQPFTWRKGIVLSATFLFSIFLIISCKKKENSIGQNTIDQNELLLSSGIDTFELTTYSYIDDSIISDNAPFAVLGSYNDPVFGTYNAEFYTQFRLETFNLDLGDLSTITVDSFILSLEYIGQYGDAGIQNIEVFEITDDLYLDSTYLSTDVANTDPLDWVYPGANAILMDEEGETIVGEDTLTQKQLRIPLSTSKAKTIFIDAVSGAGYFDDNEAFLDYFKGLHVRTTNSFSPGQGGVSYFNLNDPDSELTIYYTQNGQQKTYSFQINSSCADFNHVDVDTLSGPNNILNDQTAGMEQFYAQAFGMRAVVEIPELSTIPQNAIIHKAILELPVAYQTGTPYSPGAEVSIATNLEIGGTKLYGVNTIGYYDDYRKSFEIDIRSYVQALINKEVVNTRLIFSPLLHNTSAERIIFNGPLTTNKDKPKLYILYTEF
ncbi:MAG: DUF4270 family protein [Crocinitomicaceae bacterium]|nr:DUF4270 family protein [Crocinitomicaceae bacterium]